MDKGRGIFYLVFILDSNQTMSSYLLNNLVLLMKAYISASLFGGEQY